MTNSVSKTIITTNNLGQKSPLTFRAVSGTGDKADFWVVTVSMKNQPNAERSIKRKSDFPTAISALESFATWCGVGTEFKDHIANEVLQQVVSS
jgi:hypothetical protein